MFRRRAGWQGMRASGRPLVIVVRPGGRTGTILAWLRQLVPAAVLLVAPATFPEVGSADVITLDANDILSGPLSLADALARRHGPADVPRE